MAREADAGFNGYSSDMSTGSKLNPDSDHVPVTFHPDSLRSGEVSMEYIQGPRFRFICAAIAIMMFITNMEIPVLITALIAITSDLGGFDDVSWVVSSYLLGYVAVIIIFAKFSDIFGRKPIFLLSTTTFIVFSAACSAAQTLTQLIVFRAFQGIGGGGCFSLCTIMVFDLVPPEKYAQVVANISITNAVALLVGPIIGGAIAANTTWRWIFIINVPIAAPALVISVLAIPSGFPHHGQVRRQTTEKTLRHSAKKTLGRIDIPGTVLVLLAVLGLTAAFEEADKLFPWKSAYVISLLIVSGLLWIVLILWERYVSLSNSTREPVLPWRLLTNRRMMGIFLNFLLLGGPTVIGMFIIPQRFQLVYGTSGLDAGVRLIPFTAAIPVSSVIASSLVGKYKVPPLYLIMSGSCLQILGFGLLGTLPATLEIPARIYGYELIAGWGCGINFSLLFLMVPFVIEKRDHAIGLGAASQFRFIGSSMVLAISTSVFNSFTRPRLQELGAAGADSLVAVLATLPTVVQEQIRYTLAEGYSRQTLALCVSAALQVPASLLMWTKKPLVV
ncbi:Major facilitator superfamily domain, general substrate transporter [Metarhizium guizhouense ARSEF 977]|uniref:Major facilitator superfamily domain, general substrate transporter n=1 Tax=Metarhizium guizhouense (strain ARSEF 977) TaxID=1276136 RepID=A0A0B4H2J1_METGA|nr:Major facilitator superfamily domain, general substrate transporter [Metarhizium guizhouense ARSEF 977]